MPCGGADFRYFTPPPRKNRARLHGDVDLDKEALERLYLGLRRIRRVEEEIARLYPSDEIKSPVHLSIGQEAVAVGVCDVLRPDDVVAPTYRGHAAYLAKGGDLKAMMAELYGKESGCARGKGGSMHLIGMDRFILGASAVVGTTIPIALGFALALKREGEGRIAVAFFGDGATEEGVFYESLKRGSASPAGALRLREQFLRHPHAARQALGDRSPVRAGGNLWHSGDENCGWRRAEDSCLGYGKRGGAGASMSGPAHGCGRE